MTATTRAPAPSAPRGDASPCRLEHADPDCAGEFRADPAPGSGSPAERIVCDRCSAAYPATTRTILALAGDHVNACRLILAELPGRIARIRERRTAEAHT